MKQSAKVSQYLNKGWEFRSPDGKDWVKANIPGNIHLDLINNELIPDPFFGKNELELQWISDRDWTYRLFFTPDKDIQDRKNKEICFYGIDTYADIFLNNEKIISSNNMFHPWFANVNDVLLPGMNELTIVLRSPIKEVLPLMESLGHTLPAENDQAGKTSPFTRKAPYHYGWDWGPCFVASGIWKNVELFAWDDWKLADISITNNKVNESIAELNVSANLFSNIQEDGKMVITESKTGKSIEYPIQIKQGDNELEYSFTIDDPELWWPAGHGDQPLYDFTVLLLLSEYEQIVEKRIGIREVSIKREKDEKGESFEIHVNGVPIFAKGANWIPADSFVERLTREDYQRLIKDAVLANMNTLRIWGGGIYEPDCFYEICDEMGVLVWQDFMFACSMYPAHDEFLLSVEKEARYQLKRLKDHACIILWCGNNEIASGWLSWGWKEQLPDSVWEDYETLFHKLLPAVCKEVDPGRLYWPSSPGHSIDLPSEDQIYGSGDNHYWGVWHGGDGFEAFDSNVGRFLSEYGMQSFPDLKTIKTFAHEDDLSVDSDVMKAHQKASLGTGNLIQYIEDHYTLNGEFGSTVILSQIMQAQAIRSAVESHRRNMPFCMGTLYWQFNDCWPVISWSSVDYEGNWKALHYTAKRFFDSTLISLTEKDGMVDIYVINDIMKGCPAKLLTRVYKFDGTIIFEESIELEIGPHTSDIVKSLNKKDLIGENDPSEILIKCELLSDSGVISMNNHFFLKAKELTIPKPEFDIDHKKVNETYLITIQAHSFLYQLHLRSINVKGIFSNNYFEMLPNEVVTIEFEPDKTLDGNDDEASFEIKSIYELMN